MAFENLIGQDDIKRRLQGACTADKISHAYLFTGTRGIGKKSFANEFAKMCMCTTPLDDGSACGKCKACTLNDAGTNPDFMRIAISEGKQIIEVDKIRYDLIERTTTAPVFSRRKVFLVENADTMNESAQNALLKTLEEPPEFVTIILIVDNITMMLDTIKSRSLRIDFKRNSEKEILKKLEEMSQGKNVNEALLCAYADGVMGRVGEFVCDTEISAVRQKIINNMQGVFDGDIDARKNVLGIIDTKKKNYDFFFFQFMSFLRDAIVMARVGDKTKILNMDYKNKLEELVRTVGYYRLKNAVKAANECYTKLQQAAMAELTLEDMLNKISG